MTVEFYSMIFDLVKCYLMEDTNLLLLWECWFEGPGPEIITRNTCVRLAGEKKVQYHNNSKYKSKLTFKAFIFLVTNRRNSSPIILVTAWWRKRWRVSLGCRVTAYRHAYTSDSRQGTVRVSGLTSRVQPSLRYMGPHGGGHASMWCVSLLQEK